MPFFSDRGEGNDGFGNHSVELPGTRARTTTALRLIPGAVGTDTKASIPRAVLGNMMGGFTMQGWWGGHRCVYGGSHLLHAQPP
jgi:hypothetical protein